MGLFDIFKNKKGTKPTPPPEPLTPEQIQQLQEVMNSMYPGMMMFARDTNLSPELEAKYQPGRVIRERAFVDATARVGGMVTSHRFAILSNHMANLSMFGDENNWQLHVANRDSRFKVLGKHTHQGKTAIFLLHLPDNETWKLLRNVENNLDQQLLTDCIARFEAKCTQPPIPELAGRDWLDRCLFPVGLDDDGNFWELE